MNEFKGTPGPWRVSEKVGDFIHIRHNNNEPGAMSLNLAHVTARSSWAREAEANAHLIAAAPELLEALRQLLDYVEDMHAAQYGRHLVDESHPMFLAQAAIAKALGETK